MNETLIEICNYLLWPQEGRSTQHNEVMWRDSNLKTKYIKRD